MAQTLRSENVATASSPAPGCPRSPSTRSIVAALSGDNARRVGSRHDPMRLTLVQEVGGAELEDVRLVFAIGRRFGNAVQRNRSRRRIRGAFACVQQTADIPLGAYLVRPTRRSLTMPFPALVDCVKDLSDQLARGTT